MANFKSYPKRVYLDIVTGIIGSAGIGGNYARDDNKVFIGSYYSYGSMCSKYHNGRW